MNSKYAAILANLKESKDEVKYVNDKVLIIDSLNTFLRNFAVINHINPAGNHIGGLTGFLKSLGHIIRLVEPTRVILVFDGQGGSTNKRYLYPEYKTNRSNTRVTNWDAFDNKEEEVESITNQVIRLVDYLKCLPVDLLIIDKIEADDVIGYIANKLAGEVVIMSTDKDYLQLINDKITVYSPIKKKFYTPKDVIEEFGVTPVNFLQYKILMGDDSDNVPGVKGVGKKTILSLFPQLSSQNRVTLKEILDISADQRESKKGYMNIANFSHQLIINEKLMDLHNPNIPDSSIEEIERMLDNPNQVLDKRAFLMLYQMDKLQNSIPNTDMWLFDVFTKLQHYKTNYEQNS